MMRVSGRYCLLACLPPDSFVLRGMFFLPAFYLSAKYHTSKNPAICGVFAYDCYQQFATQYNRWIGGKVSLLQLDFAASGLDGSFELVGVLLLHPLLKQGRGCVNEVLCLLKAKTKRVFNRLDDLHLGCARVGQVSIVRRLLLLCLARACGGGRCASRRRYAPVRFERFDELVELEHRHLFYLVHQAFEFLIHNLFYLSNPYEFDVFSAFACSTTAKRWSGLLISCTNCARSASMPGIAAIDEISSLLTNLPANTPPANARCSPNFLTKTASSRGAANSSLFVLSADKSAGAYASAISPCNSGASSLYPAALSAK